MTTDAARSAQVSEIRDKAEAMKNPSEMAIHLLVSGYTMRGFDPLDVRQAAEEALANLRS